MNADAKTTLNLCRLCANYTEAILCNNLFHKNNANLRKAIKDLTGLFLRDGPRPQLPRYFCTKCKDELKRAYEFRRQIIKTQDYFWSTHNKNKCEIQISSADDWKAAKAVQDISAAEHVELFLKSEPAEELNGNLNEKGTRKRNAVEQSSNKIEDAESNELETSQDFVIDSRKPKPALKKKFISSDILKNRDYKCHLCHFPLYNLICLKIHFQKQHKREQFKCDLCEEKFPTTKSLERHLRMHKGEKAYKCHYCDMTFTYSTIRCRHERREHAKDSPFLCSYCGKKFISSHTYRDHLTVHTKERAYRCSVCKSDFLRKNNLQTHFRSVTHKNNVQKLNSEKLTMKATQNVTQHNLQN